MVEDMDQRKTYTWSGREDLKEKFNQLLLQIEMLAKEITQNQVKVLSAQTKNLEGVDQDDINQLKDYEHDPVIIVSDASSQHES